MKELQMTAVMATSLAGAPSTSSPSWDTIHRQKAKSEVHRLQMCIAKAF